jgi:DNA-binding MarR family transcriptional regulator
MAGGASQLEQAQAGGDDAERERALIELGLAFRRVWRSLGSLRGRDTHLAGGELTHAQFELLLELDEHGELSAGELAAAARMAPGTVTQMLEHLALGGQVERARSRDDRRVVVSRLTAAGRARVEAKRAAWKERWAQALGDLDAERLRAAGEVLDRLGSMVEAAGPTGGRMACESGPAGPLDADDPLL